MSNEMTNAPKIRFNGFTEDWEQRKLGDMANFLKGNGYSKSDLVNEGHPVILYGRLYTKYETIIETVDTFVKLKDKSVLSEGGEVIVPASGENAEDISRASVVNAKEVALGGDLNIIKANLDLNPIFLALTISNGSQQKEMIKRAQGKSVVHLHNSDLKEINIIYPKIEEQVHIGLFFKQLDDTIALYQRELDLLKQTKQTYLQKMFPKSGENKPEIRFAGFTDAWELRKLGDISPLRGGFAFKSDEFKKVGIPIVRISNILPNGLVGGEFVYYELQENDESYLLPDKSTILAMSGATTGKVAILNNPNDDKVYQNQRVGYFTKIESVSYNFIATLVRSQLFLDQLSSVLVAGAQPNISSKDINGFEFNIPKDFEEQQKIGIFFQHLDDTIALHQRKLDSLKEMKKSLLQQMFV